MQLKLPTAIKLNAAYDRAVPEIVGAGLWVLFCRINPSVYSAAVGHHFARPGNRFWPTLSAPAFTDRLLHPQDDRELLRYRRVPAGISPGRTR